jgi:hypothetical protein
MNQAKVNLERKSKFIMASEVKNAELEAKQNAPVDTGKHKQGIHGVLKDGGMSGKLVANELYAPYLEFGTGGTVSVPTGYEEIAMGYKGKGIRKINRKPHPHIIPAAVNAYERLVKRIDKELDNL